MLGACRLISSKAGCARRIRSTQFALNFRTYARQAATTRAATTPTSTEPDISMVGESLIPTINKLQEIFSFVGAKVDLPQIVVVGGQSSGKSSVLENVVGRDFLPRGSGIVTRRPLILQLRTLEEGQKDYGEFLHKPGEKFFDFGAIKAEIEKETDRVAGGNKGISSDPILLKVYSPRVVPLTLVDTPGMARVAIGDQPVNIEQQIRSLIKEYIFQPNSIILAVQAANQDLATSDALQLAKEADPEGARTVGVLTKLDLMDKGTDAMPILLGRSFPLRRGWTAIVNRSQQDIVNSKSIISAQQRENEFFKSHPAYADIADKCGSRVLAEKCNKLLSEHIKKSLPSLKYEVSKMLREKTEELESYGQPFPTDPSSQGWQLLRLCNKASELIKDSILGQGKAFNKAANVTAQLNGGARIRFIFHDVFTRNLEAISPTSGLTTRDIRTTIKNASGSKSALFVPDEAFESLAHRQIKWLKEPAIQCAESVHHELLKIISDLEHKDLARFWKLHDAIVDIATTVLRDRLTETNALINQILETELAYINTSHPDFIGFDFTRLADPKETQELVEDVKKPDSKKGGFFGWVFGSSAPEKPKAAADNTFGEESQLTEREKSQIVMIRKLLESYIGITKKNIQDQVVKVIMHTLVRGSIKDLKRELIKKLYHEQKDYKNLLSEADDIEIKRRVCKEELDALIRASKVLQDL